MNTTTTRCIGGRSSARSLAQLREITDRMIGLCTDYRSVALLAVRAHDARVYVPAALTEQNIDSFFSRLTAPQSFGNDNGEPCYVCLEQGNKGRNADGTQHKGYIIIDVVERIAIDLVDRDGVTKLQTPLVQFATMEKVIA